MRLIWSFEKKYNNPFDMSWEEEHVCILCSGDGCRGCRDKKVKETPIVSKPVAPVITMNIGDDVRLFIAKQKEEAERTDAASRAAMAENMRKDLGRIADLIKIEWKR